MLPSLDLDEVSLVRLDEMGALGLKIKLELEDPEGCYLVYSPEMEPFSTRPMDAAFCTSGWCPVFATRTAFFQGRWNPSSRLPLETGFL
jgi:hypothetical protein